MNRFLAFLLGCAILGHTSEARAQYLTRPHLKWETIETPHFSIHFPAEMRAWTETVARHIESVAAEVNAVVGHEPQARVTVLVEDPSNVSNGFALPFLDAPVIFLWPTPPSPSPTFGVHRGWGEILAVHEYAHIAHLTIPTRNPWERRFWKFMPVRIGPVARNAPAWVFEGYATLVEGRLTGNGRPASVGRAAVLRQWALEGRLPTYAQLNSAGPFLGGSMRYLVGSAFLEWLEARQGDSSLVHLWRRMSARQQRSFASAFTGVFGAPPDELYGRFFVEVTARALDVEKTLTEAGLVEGELVQRLSAGTGDPAVSPDGTLVALVLRSLTGPSRLVVWNAEPDPKQDSAALRARQRLLERDPLDVPAVDSFPRPRRAVATLHPAAGRSHELPRWMPDGVNLLVSRDEPLGDGASRPDLFLWNHETGRVRRVTHGAAIRHADPAPDGLRATGVRCHAGVCSLVIVDLATGAWRVLAAGSPHVVWHRPRWSPDGSTIAAGRHSEGRWQIALVDARSGAARALDPGDGASRYAPAFAPSGRELVAVSERGGVANLELLAVDGTVRRTLTRVLGSVAAPEVRRTDGSAWFLSLHARGYDLRRLPIDAGPSAGDLVALAPRLYPAAPRPPAREPVMFTADAEVQVRDYGLGPRGWRVLPGGITDADGLLATVMVANVDPISRFNVVAQGGFGQRGTWRGASLSAALRRSVIALEGSAWHAEQRPSAGEAAGFAPSVADVRFTGTGALATYSREGGLLGLTLRGGASYGVVDGDLLDDARRAAAHGEARGRLTFSVARLTIGMHASGAYASGRTRGESWNRSVGAATFTLGTQRRWLRGDVVRGNVTRAGPGEAGRAFEYFVVGGSSAPYLDRTWLSQRVALPSVPTGYLAGRRLGMYRAAIGGGFVEPWFMWVAAGDTLDAWKRIVGAERELTLPSLGFARLPGVRVRFGVGYSFDEPFKYRTRGYAGVTYRP